MKTFMAIGLLAFSSMTLACGWTAGPPPPCTYNEPTYQEAIMIHQDQQAQQAAEMQARQDQMEADQRAEQQYQQQHQFDNYRPDNNPSIYGTQVYGGRY